jgi:transcriptional regulator with XRE-family HTH domain
MGREINDHVGARIRSRRRELGLTQGELGRLVGLAHQTIHKFEGGASRICAEHLWRLSIALDVPVGHFFEGLESKATAPLSRRSGPRKAN